MAQLMFPDIGASFRDGQAFGMQQRQLREQEGRRSGLASLASQAYTAPQEQRASILSQMAGLDPRAASQQSEQFDSSDDRNTKQLLSMARLLVAAPEGDKPSIYDRMRPALNQLGLQTPDYGPGVIDTAQKLLQAWGPASQQEQFTLSPGSARYDAQGRLLVQQAFAPQTRIFEGDGGVYGIDTRTLQATPVSVGGGSLGSPISMPSDLNGAFSALAGKYGAQITSTLRTPERNAQVGGVPNSQHLKGTAADFVVPLDRRGQFIQEARELGFEAIDEGDHVHLEQPPGAPRGAQLQAAPKDRAPSDIEKRIALAQQMGASADDIRRMVIGREGAAAGAKPLPVGALKELLDVQDATAGAGTLASLIKKNADRMQNGSLVVGPANSIGARLRTSFGMSNPNDVNITEFKADMKRVVNESLRLNKGVQTEGDAQRAADELMAADDQATAARALRRLAELNARAAKLQQAKQALIRKNYGQDSAGNPAASSAPAVAGGWSIQKVD